MWIVGFIALIVLCYVAIFIETHRIDRKYDMPANVVIGIGYIQVLSIVIGVCIGQIIGILVWRNVV